MATKTAFSLRHLIREVAASSALTDPGALAKEVAKRVPEEHIHDAFEEMLRPYVRQVIAEGRTFPARDSQQSKTRPPAGRPGNRSWKRDGIKLEWAKVLRERVHVGPAASDWKLFGDCDAADLDFMIEERERIADANHAKADQYRKVRRLVAEHGVATVRELPEQVLTDAFGGAE